MGTWFPRSLSALPEHADYEHYQGCERNDQNGSPDQDVGCTPSNRTGAEEDRDGDSAHDNRNNDEGPPQLDGRCHQASVGFLCRFDQRHFSITSQVCLNSNIPIRLFKSYPILKIRELKKKRVNSSLSALPEEGDDSHDQRCKDDGQDRAPDKDEGWTARPDGP
jgi:hypothetical protein